MRVKVKTNFIGQAEIDVQNPTLKKVLMEVSQKNTVPLLDPETDEVHSDYKVYLNGIDHEVLPERIETKLRSGDLVEVNLIMLAGG
jgi:hypothetical protein